jgi:hypothetical protein
MADQAHDGGEKEKTEKSQQAYRNQEEPAAASHGNTSLRLRKELTEYLQTLKGLVSQVSCSWHKPGANHCCVSVLAVARISVFVQEDGTPLIEFPKTFSAQVHFLMESRKHRGLGAIMCADETAASPGKQNRAFHRQQSSSEADTETSQYQEDTLMSDKVKQL